MALWGNRDDLVSTDFTPTAPTAVTIVGTASSEFWTAEADNGSFAGVSTGTSILLDNGAAGFATIEAVISPTLVKVGKMSAVAAGAGQAATYATQPISLKNDPGFAESSADGSLGRTQVLAGISTAGVAAAGLTTTSGGFHAGWVGITTYVDMHGKLRTKTETFVAASGIQTGNRPFPV